MMTAKYLLALAFIALLSITDYFLIETRRAANETGVSIMLAVGREITLVGRIAGLSQFLVLADEESRPEIRERLVAAIAEGEKVRQRLEELSQTDGRGAIAKFFELGVRMPPFNELQVENFLKSARELAVAPDPELTPENDALSAIRHAVLGERLTDTLDRFERNYRSARMRDVGRLQSLLRWTLLTMIGVLVGTSLFVFRPMSHRIQQEVAELEASEAYSRAIVESAKDGIIATDSTGRIDLINPSAAQIFGLKTETALGQDATELLPWPTRELPAQAAAESGAQGRRSDGSTFPLDLTISEAEVGGRTLSIGIVRDITERRRLEEEKLRAERLATVGAMSAVLAHEIRNPLGSIKLNLQLLAELIAEWRNGSTTSGEEVQQLFRPISSELERIRRVTDNYLLFARLPHAQHKEVSLNEILDRGLRLMKPTFEQGKVQVSLALDSACPKVFGDVEQLWQAFLNLIRNALEAMPGGGNLTIRTTHSPDEVEVAITDSGIGVNEHQRTRLFEPFFTTKSTGTGLGLALVQQIVREHGGCISCRSALGQGTSFEISLPPAEKHSLSRALA
jgi:PAS domain S-box-containing protein